MSGKVHPAYVAGNLQPPSWRYPSNSIRHTREGSFIQLPVNGHWTWRKAYWEVPMHATVSLDPYLKPVIDQTVERLVESADGRLWIESL